MDDTMQFTLFHPSGAKVTHTIAATGTPAEQLDVVSKIIGYVEYRSVLGFPDYRVGSDGTVWSRKVKGSKTGRTGEWKKLKSASLPSGHQFVTLCRPDGVHQLLVHRLVLEAFAGPCPTGMQCCHNDGNPRNNRAANLRWDTSKGNSADTIKHGRSNRGERHEMAKLTKEIVQAIRSEHASGVQQTELSKRYGISKANVCLIVNRKAWRHV